MTGRACLALAWAAVLIGTAGCTGERTPRTPYRLAIGDAADGEQLARAVGCGACHTIPGVRGAHGMVGPPLTAWARRTYIAGWLPNTPDNLVRWLQHPEALDPRTAMPTAGLDERQARDIAAYLYTLR